MSDSEFFLDSSTRAVAGSEDAVHLIEQKERVEQAVVSNDPALTLDTAKAFLESILKTILSDRAPEPNLEQKMNPLLKDVKEVLPFNRDEDANTILGRLAGCIVHNVAELRNSYGAASHGDDGYYDNPIEMPEAEMIAHVVDGLAGFLFRKHKTHGNPELSVRIYYNDHPEFNDFIDNQYDGYQFPLGENKVLDLSPSKLLFLADEDAFAYREMLLQYLSTEKEDQEVIQAQPEQIVEIVEKPQEVTEPIPEAVPTPIEEGVQQIMQSLLVNDEARVSVNDDELRHVAEFVVDFAQNRAGLDWQKREPLRARFRTFLRRELIKVTFSEAFMDQAMEHAIEKAAELYPSRMGI
jgi:hypothetical protein